MPKAVLVMDMPESCAKCDFCQNLDERWLCCNRKDKTALAFVRPDWCPLVELPEKMKTGTGGYGENMFRSGFNACLDEILRERKE